MFAQSKEVKYQASNSMQAVSDLVVASVICCEELASMGDDVLLKA